MKSVTKKKAVFSLEKEARDSNNLKVLEDTRKILTPAILVGNVSIICMMNDRTWMVSRLAVLVQSLLQYKTTNTNIPISVFNFAGGRLIKNSASLFINPKAGNHPP